MSLLRRLTEQAQQVKDAEAAQESARADRKDRFNKLTLPAMHALGAFLTEITDQLKVVRPPLQQSFDLPGYGTFPTASLFDFAVRVEPRYSEVIVELNWKSRIDTERAPKLVLNSFDRIRNLSELFKRLHLGGFKDEKRGPGGHVIACTLQATGFISSRMVVTATLEDDVARFAFENVDQLIATRQSIPISLFSDEMCERLGEFLLRDNDIFIREQWVRSLSPPAKPFRPANLEERAVVALNAAAPIAASQDGGAVSLNIESGFSRASAQRQDRDNALLAELSEASRMAEAVVTQTIATGPLSAYSEERTLGGVQSSAAGLADMYRQPAAPAVAGPAPVAAKPAAAVAPQAPPAAAIPQAPARPVATAAASVAPAVPTPVSRPATPPTGSTPANRPSSTVAAPTPAQPAGPPVRPAVPAATARPAAPTPTATAAVQPAAPVARPAAPAAPSAPPLKPATPAAAVPAAAARPAASAPAPSWTPAAPPPAAKPAATAAPLATASAPSPAPAQPEPTEQAQPAVARSFMDRFQKMRSELERKP